jgi:hypothetical protein
MGEKIEFRKPSFRRPTKVRKALDAVAFVNDKHVIGFKLETAGSHSIGLEIEAVPEAKQLYDFFNGIFRKYASQGIESGGLSKGYASLMSADWFLEKEKVNHVIQEVEQKMGPDWGKAISWLFEKL